MAADEIDVDTPVEPDGSTTVGDDGPAEPAGPPAKNLRWRRRLVLLLVVMTSFGMLTSTVAIWTHQTLLNTDKWVERVAPVAQDPAVQQAMAVALTDQLMEVLDAEKLLTEALPSKVDFLATPLSTAVHDFVQQTVLKLLQSDQFERLWLAINRYGHQAVVNFLRGDSRLVQSDNGVVTVNVLPVLARALQAVQEKVPRLLEGKDIPTLTYDMSVEQQNQALSQALGRQLKPEFGVYTLFQSDQLASVQRGVELFDQAVWVLAIVTVLLAAAAIALSTRRWRTVVQLGVGIALAMALAMAAIKAVMNLILELITNPTNRAAVSNTLKQVLGSFNEIAQLLLAFGIVVVLAAFLSGDSKWAKSFRQLIGRASGAAASTASTAAHRGREAPFPWLAKHRLLLLIAGPVLAAVWLLLADATFGLMLVILLLLGAYELIVLLLSYEPASLPEDAVGPSDAPRSTVVPDASP